MFRTQKEKIEEKERNMRLLTYTFRDKVLKPGEQISVKFEYSFGPSVVITVDPDMFEALETMNYGSLRAVDKDFVIRRHCWPCEYEAFVSKLNQEVVTKILAELNHCQPKEIFITTFPAPTARDIREAARFVKDRLNYLSN